MLRGGLGGAIALNLSGIKPTISAPGVQRGGLGGALALTLSGIKPTIRPQACRGVG